MITAHIIIAPQKAGGSFPEGGSQSMLALIKAVALLSKLSLSLFRSSWRL